MIPKSGAVLASATLLLLACQSPTPDPALAAPEIGPKHALVVPLNVTIRPPDGFDADTGPVWEALIAHLRSSGFEPEAVSFDRSAVLWEQAMAEVKRSHARADLRKAWSRFARRLGEGKPHEWVVVPSLILRRAHVSGHQVHWDGVNRDLQIPFALEQRLLPRADAASVSFDGYSGVLAAASLHVAILTTEGQLDWEGLGGLVVVQQLDPLESSKRDEWRFQPRPEPFGESGHVRAGVALAFARPLPGSSRFRDPEALRAEPEQPPPPANME